MEFSEYLNPCSGDVFYSRSDPNDVRLGDVVCRDMSDYSKSSVVMIGCPQDEGVVRNKGREGSRFAPGEIRKFFYRYPHTEDHENLRLIDVGDIKIQGSLEETHDVLYKVVHRALQDGKLVVCLGGGNDISYPDCAALAAESERLLVFNIDRHLDVRADQPRNSGTPYRQLLDEGVIEPKYLHEVGINSFANSKSYVHLVQERGAHIHYLGDIRGRVGSTVEAIVKKSDADAIFFGFDLDVVGANEAPGVSDPGPMGLTAREVCEIADVAAADPRTRLIEITEVNPDCDIGGMTSKLAANIIVRALARARQ